MPFSYRGEASDHEANHANPQHGLTMIQPHLIVTAQASRFAEPAKGSFDYPTFGQDFETFGVVAPPYDFQMQLAERPQLFDPLDQSAQVAAIGPDDLQPSKHLDQRANQILGGGAILDGGTGNHYAQHQPERVHRQVAFAALDLFARVVAGFSSLIGSFDRLAVNDRGRRCHLSAFGLAQPVAQGVVNKGPSPILAPLAKVAVDRLPWTEILGQEPPRTTGPDFVADRVEQRAPIQLKRTPTFAFAGFGLRDQGLDLVPFFIGEIGRIFDWMRLHPSYL